MRLAMVLLAAAPAFADPLDPDPEEPAPKVVPHMRGQSEAQRGIELVPSIEYQRDRALAPNMGSGSSAGTVIQPPWHNDMRPYAEGGMVMTPPWTGDDMRIAPGTRALPDRTRWQSWWRAFQRGVDSVIEKAVPSAGST